MVELGNYEVSNIWSLLEPCVIYSDETGNKSYVTTCSTGQGIYGHLSRACHCRWNNFTTQVVNLFYSVASCITASNKTFIRVCAKNTLNSILHIISKCLLIVPWRKAGDHVLSCIRLALLLMICRAAYMSAYYSSHIDSRYCIG